ncbi:MAG: BrxE family protein [Candidatus Marinimicrobia bacterium]|nr:BrxE family protein [Candidatus Neomarinimicrobiota bacterium]
MENNLIELIVETRFLVGFLGEKEQANWWGSSFLSKSSSAFLTPVFPKTTPTAQYHGICQAAKRVHDEHIGLGRNYHLYRLPDSIERSLANAMNDQDL